MPREKLHGVHAPHRKNTAGEKPQRMPTPATVTIPVSMHIGAPAKKDGGAIYEANGVRDLSANQLFRLCDDQRYDFLSLKEGDLVWAPNRIGIYIGAHLVVECSASEKAVKARIVQDGGWKMCGQLRRFVSYQTANAAPRGDEYAEFSQGNKARKGSKR